MYREGKLFVVLPYWILAIAADFVVGAQPPGL
jgi:hypothetical protein